MILLNKEDVQKTFVTTPGVGKRLTDKLDQLDPVEAIPIEWINEHIAWLGSLDANIGDQDARSIRVMLMKWRSEQKTKGDGCTADYCSI